MIQHTDPITADQCPAEHHDGHQCGRGAGHLGPHDAGPDTDAAREVMIRAERVATDLLHDTGLPLGDIHISAIHAAAMARGHTVDDVVRVQLDTVDQVVAYAHTWSASVAGRRYRRSGGRGSVATTTVRGGLGVRAWCPASSEELDALGVPALDAQGVAQ